jgi:hypothetical protein
MKIILTNLNESKYDEYIGQLTKKCMPVIRDLLRSRYDNFYDYLMRPENAEKYKTTEDLIKAGLKYSPGNFFKKVKIDDKKLNFVHFDILLWAEPYIAVGAAAEPGEIYVSLKIPVQDYMKSMQSYRQKKNKEFINYNKINTELSSVLYHEFTHINQYTDSPSIHKDNEKLFKLPQIDLSQPDEPLSNIKLEIKKLERLRYYFLSEYEKEAYMAGMYKEAKKTKTTYSSVVKKTVQNFLDQYHDHYLQRYLSNKTPKTALISRQCILEVFTILIPFFTGLIENVKHVYPNAQIEQKDIEEFYSKNMEHYRQYKTLVKKAI